MQQVTSTRALFRVVGLACKPARGRAASSGPLRTPVARLGRQVAAGAAPATQQQAASTGGEPAVPPPPAPPAAAALLQRLLASSSLSDRSTLLLAAALLGGLVLGAAEPALAAQHADATSGAAGPQLLADLAENEDFWGNVLRYISYFFSVLLGTVYIAVKPIIELLKKPTTAVLVVAGIGGLVYFVSFTVQAMLGISDPIDYTASSIVTPIS